VSTVRRAEDVALVPGPVVALDAGDPADAIRAHAPGGVDRIVEVAFSDNADLDAAVAGNGAVIAAYATRAERPELPFWPMLFDNLTIRLLGSDDFPAEAKQQAAADLTAAARDGDLAFAVAEPLPLEDAARAHDEVDAGNRRRVLLAIDTPTTPTQRRVTP
jgi:NADPH2:quinone reductase